MRTHRGHRVVPTTGTSTIYALMIDGRLVDTGMRDLTTVARQIIEHFPAGERGFLRDAIGDPSDIVVGTKFTLHTTTRCGRNDTTEHRVVVQEIVQS